MAFAAGLICEPATGATVDPVVFVATTGGNATPVELGTADAAVEEATVPEGGNEAVDTVPPFVTATVEFVAPLVDAALGPGLTLAVRFCADECNVFAARLGIATPSCAPRSPRVRVDDRWVDEP